MEKNLTDQLNRIEKNVEEIRERSIQMYAAQKVHNHILKEHERRSTMLEEKIIPIEDHVKFMTTLFRGTTVLGVISLAIGIIAVISRFS